MKKKYNEMLRELLKLGLNGVRQKYHPDKFPDNPYANSIIDIYKAMNDKILDILLVDEEEDNEYSRN